MKTQLYRHKKRGTTYRILQSGHFNTSAPELKTADRVPVVVYQNVETGHVEVRFTSEFHDGRFEVIPMSGFKIPSESDPRPAKGSWCPGNYVCICVSCGKSFTGYKRSYSCAPCAYGDEEPKA